MKLNHVSIKRTLRLGVCLTALSASTCFADRLSEMASPISNPVNFEDPRIDTEIKPVYVHHAIDNKFVTGGGAVDIIALQARYALTDDLALIATKDGLVSFRPDSALNDGTGFANVAGGVKYSFYKDEQSASIATAGLRYEAPIGAKAVLQGQGDGIINPFISAATAVGDFNIIGYTGVRAPLNSEESTLLDASLHVDTKVGCISPLFELNLVNVLSAGDRLPIADEGQDFFNLGSANSDGKTMLTAAFGARVPLAENVSFGAAYEVPLATGSGTYITDWRVTSDVIVQF